MTNRSFVAGLVVCVALMMILGGSLFLLNHGHSRPEGVAENWLTAIGDTTRKGVEADATKRADKVGAPELARNVLEPHAELIHRKSGFDDLEVGKATPVSPYTPNKVRVAFRVHALRPHDKTVEIDGVLTLQRNPKKWMVTELNVVDPATVGVAKLPSDGGPPPSSAGYSLWLAALIGAGVTGVVTTTLVKVAGRGAPTTAASAV